MATWQNLTLADVFPAQAQALDKIHKQATDIFNKSTAVADQLQRKIDALNNIIGTTTGLLGDIQEAGFYVLMLEPNSGGIVQRIQSASNPPPVDAYSAGIVIGVSAPDLPTIVNKYQKLINVITSPIDIPG
ncbi:MAG: hypothetical protein DSY47_00020 [Hydrogenothermus sp.]|nr:MAG: hypothetical protein DSY47_00020 [Hydrogenothermus sp.]